MIETVREKQKTWQENLREKLHLVWFVAFLLTVSAFAATFAVLYFKDNPPSWLLSLAQADHPLQAAVRFLVAGSAGGVLMALSAGLGVWLVGRLRLVWLHAVLAVVNAGVLVFAVTVVA